LISVHDCRGSRVASTGVQGGPRGSPLPDPYGDADAARDADTPERL